MKEIKVFGSGCSTCRKLKILIEAIVNEHNIAAKVEYSDDFGEISQLGILSLPAVVIDGKVKSSGTIPRRNEILAWLV